MSVIRGSVKLKIGILYVVLSAVLLLMTKGLLFPIGAVFMLFSPVLSGLSVQLFCKEQQCDGLGVWYGQFTSFLVFIFLLGSLYQFSSYFDLSDTLLVAAVYLLAVFLTYFLSKFTFNVYMDKKRKQSS